MRPGTISTCDPHLFGIDLVHEYELCSRLYGFTAEDFMDINRRAVEHSFLDPDIRAGVLNSHFPGPGRRA